MDWKGTGKRKGNENGEKERWRKRRKGRGRVKKGEGERKRAEEKLVARTDRHSSDFILCPMLCIALDRQK